MASSSRSPCDGQLAMLFSDVVPELQGAAFAAREIVAVVLLVAALSKMRDLEDFLSTVRGYGLVPDPLNRLIVVVVPLLEFVLGTALLVGVLTHVVVLASAGLLAAFTAWLILALARGRTIDCGCFSSSAPRRLSWRLVIRNVVLVTLLVIPATEAPLVSLDQLVFQSERTYSYASVVPGLVLATVGISLFAIGTSCNWLLKQARKERP